MITARVFAKALNCVHAGPEPCGTCPSCVKIDKDGHPDVQIISSGTDAIKIESVRQIKQGASLKPYEGKKKVFVIDNAHNLTAEASNAILKVLEEPPGESILILVTSKPSRLFRTVVSRCRLVKFRPLKRGDLERILTEQFGINSASAHFLAYFAEGRIGLALKLKDSGLEQEKNSVIDSLLSAKPGIFGYKAQFPDDETLQRHLGILAAWFRDIALAKTGMPHAQFINLDRKEEIIKCINRYSFTELNDIVGMISDSALRLDQNVNSRLVMSNLYAEIARS